MMNPLKTAKTAGLSLAVAFSTLAFAPAAQASTVTLEYANSTTPWGTPRWARSVTYELNGESSTQSAGLFRLRDSATGRSILAWCIELTQRLASPTVYDTMTAVASAAQMENIDRLFTYNYASVVDADTAAGFQLALWEIMSDTGSAEGLDLTNGAFTTGGAEAYYTAASDFLANMGQRTGRYELTTFYSEERQDLVSAAVPLPATALLMLSGIAGAGFVGRRRRKS